MSSPENRGFNESPNRRPYHEELGPDWHLPLFETKRKKRLNDWYAYLWCFCEISKRSINSIQMDDANWLDDLNREIQKLKALGIRLDKRKNTPEDDTEIRALLAEFIDDRDLQIPETTKIRHFFEDLDTVRRLLHDLKNAHTPIYLSLYVYQKDPSDINKIKLEHQIIQGFRKLQNYATYAKQVLMSIKLGEPKERPIQEMNLFELLEIIQLSTQSNLIAEDPNKSVQLEGLEQVREFIQAHPNLVFLGRPLDFEGLLGNIAKNCVEQYSEVRDHRHPNRANDNRVMRIQLKLIPSSEDTPYKLQIAFTIEDQATGYPPKILQLGFTKGESEKSKGWGVGMEDYVRRMSSYVTFELDNFNFDTSASDPDNPIGSGARTTVLFDVHEKFE